MATKDIERRIDVLKAQLSRREPDCGFGVILKELNYLEGLISQ